MLVIDCNSTAHAAPILAIINDAILHSTALYDYQSRSLTMKQEWFQAKLDGGYPVLGVVAETAPAELLGFATYGPFRPRPANKYTVEHSIYIHAAHRGKGLGRLLLQRLIERATEQQYHVMIGAIDVSNQGSIALHAKMGFTPAGTLREVGFKFGRWLDLAFYQRILATPDRPVEE